MEEHTLQIAAIPAQAPVYLQATGLFLLRYGLTAMMLLFGLQNGRRERPKVSNHGFPIAPKNPTSTGKVGEVPEKCGSLNRK